MGVGEGPQHVPGDGNDNTTDVVVAASKIARVAVESDKLLSSAFEDIDPDTRALLDKRTLESPESQSKFFSQPETNKLHAIFRFLAFDARRECDKAEEYQADDRTLNDLYITLEAREESENMLSELIRTGDKEQTVSEIINQIRLIITELQAKANAGYAGLAEELRDYVSLLDSVLIYANPENLNTFFRENEKFRRYIVGLEENDEG